MASRGPGGAVCKLSDAQLDRLTDQLDRGPAAQDWAGWAGDQRWTLARVAALIHRLFGVSYTLRGVSYLLHRIGWTPHVPARRLAGHDLGEGARLAAQQGAWICFEDEAGQTLRPPRGRTWGRRGHTPVVRVSGKGSGRISMAGLLTYRTGYRPHLYYRLVVHRGRRGERRSLSEADYATLLSAAHQQLHASIILIWDNLNTHVSERMQAFVAAHADWLTVVRLPAYAPELNATEGVWSHLKRRPGQLCHHRHRPVKTRLKRVQYHPELLDGFLGQTGLILQPVPP